MAGKKTGQTGRKRGAQSAAPRQERSTAELRRVVETGEGDVSPIDALHDLTARGAPRLGALLAATATEAENADLRAAATAALGNRATKRRREVLMQVLDDQDPHVVRRAAEALGRIGGQPELERLRALRPRDQVVKWAVDAAKTLLSYKTGSKRGLLSAPASDEVLELGDQRARDVSVSAVPEGLLDGIGERLSTEAPGVPLADSAHIVRCGRAEYLLVYHRSLAGRRPASALAGTSSVLGVLLRRYDVDGTYHLDGHLLSHPGRGATAHLFVMRPTGEVSHHGRLTLGESEVSFEVTAMNTRHTLPLALEGVLRYDPLDLVLVRGSVATDKAVVQPSPKRPRQIRTVRP